MNTFKKYLLYEAPGDDEMPPDIPEDNPEPPPDDMPDMGGDMSDLNIDDAGMPPDMGDMGGMGDMGMGGDDGFGGEDQQNGDLPDENLAINDKISLLMNVNLYNHYLSLRDKLRGELSSINNNKDILFSVSPDIEDIVSSLTKLEDNLSTYMRNLFNNESYSNNLLFFNKCVNLYKIIIDEFNDLTKKGIKDEFQ